MNLYILYNQVTLFIGNELAVLDGELAVPCHPQSATVGLNSLPRLSFVWTVFM